jgi:preprotein translocase subunit SecE
MAAQDDDIKTQQPSDTEVSGDQSVTTAEDPYRESAEAAEEQVVPTHLGATKYVHAAFFAGGILIAYLSGKILLTIWNNLADWSVAVRLVPQLLNYAEDQRETYTMIGGALIGLLAVLQTYRREKIRRGADEVAAELSKVTWPNKETVSNGTVVVIVASAIATVYIALLDRFWGFVTTLIYGV